LSKDRNMSPKHMWIRAALSQSELDVLDAIGPANKKPGARITSVGEQGAAVLSTITGLVDAKALSGARLVRVIWFAKNETSNWGVAWHQDRIIAVARRVDLAGFSNWTLKSGIWHCAPPEYLLRQMCFVRIHLDDSDATNGAMQIAFGSEAAGVVASQDAAKVAASYPVETCTAKRGDQQILPMLTLHQSTASHTAAPRRAIRLDFAGFELPAPLKWAELLGS
jgi:hypothetical protein